MSLTFDDGPTPGCTDRVLDVLGERGVRGTFFVIGWNVERWPELVRRMDAEGHLVGNHSFDHGHLDMFRGAGYWNGQMSRTAELINQIIGKRPALFRPPMGFTTPFIHYAARRRGQTVVTWSRRARDGRPARSGDLVGRIMRGTGGGDILMLHDGIDPHLRDRDGRDRAATIAALPPLLGAPGQRGLESVRLDELLGVAGYVEAPAVSVLPTASVVRAIQ